VFKYLPDQHFSKPLRHATPVFLWRHTVRKRLSDPQAPFVPVELAPRL